jgi:hypothetical protein
MDKFKSGNEIESDLENGISSFLKGDEKSFLDIHKLYASQLEKKGNLSAKLAKLWELYKKLFQKLAKTAAIVSISALPLVACTSDKKETAKVQNPPVRDNNDPVTSDATKTEPVVDATKPADPVADATANVTPPPMKPIIIKSKYRVYRPAMKYGIRKPRYGAVRRP